jgi:hypothetical protein
MFGDGGFTEKSNSLKWIAAALGAALLILLPIGLIFTRFGMEEFIKAAFMWAVVLVSIVYVSKEQRRKLWFWTTLLVCTPGHLWLASYYLEGINGAPIKFLAMVATLEIMVVIIILAVVEARVTPAKSLFKKPQDNLTGPET